MKTMKTNFITESELAELRKLAIASLRVYNRVSKFQDKLAKKGIFLPNGLAINHDLFSATRKLTADSTNI